jgi:hypothetical protein
LWLGWLVDGPRLESEYVRGDHVHQEYYQEDRPTGIMPGAFEDSKERDEEDYEPNGKREPETTEA